MYFSNDLKIKAMKKILLFFLVISIVACEEQRQNDYVTFSGTIMNPNSDSITVRKKGYSKTIKVDANGRFSDTLKVSPGTYSFNDGKEGSSIFLKNGYDLTMTMDTREFDESIKYEGEGAENNNFLVEKILLEEKLLEADFDSMDENQLEVAMDSVKKQMISFLDNSKAIDTMLTNDLRDRFEATLDSYKNYYGGIISLRKSLPQGSPSPVWKEYKNFKGGTTSLEDLKGKYVYVDVWATWCAPCKAEIPYLKKIEADFHDKNIAFVSMSIDDDRTHKGSWEQAEKDWRAMVADKELGGIQIMAPEGWDSDFVQAYKIKGIPRFILIDPNGKIIDPNAPRPSSEQLRETLETLL